MQQCEVTIVNRLGLHARPAVKLVSLCSKYVSSVVLVVNGATRGGPAPDRDPPALSVHGYASFDPGPGTG